MSSLVKSSLEYPFAEVPAPGATLEVAPGVRWLSMPLPFQLDHINLWLLEDGDGSTVVDTGIGNAQTRALWEQILTRKVKRVILTHYHPDHAGNAAWLLARDGAPMWTTQGEYLTAHAVRSSSAGYTADAVLAVFRANGLDAERLKGMAEMRGNNRYAELVPEFPHSYRRIIDADRVRIGEHEWTAIIGHGHAPEHLSLFSKELNTLIAGDMLLSTISTNVSVWSIDPEGDPLRLFLDSIARYRELPQDVLVLPSHGRPFRGAHTRVAELERHHQEKFEILSGVLRARPQSAGELLGVLFPKRKLDLHQTFFAMGEAIAHLHYLYYAGRATREPGDDGIMRYATR
ncbi:MAG TPA: MBL fold metallo-hydrolase [Burkholderiales bacterium]|nr:MBL fold metallo-hydrolase [Burkholderiales bacterium]